MPYTNPLSRLTFPLGITNWGTIKTSGVQLLTECLKKGKSSGGQMFVKDSTSTHPVLVIFMWASGANFEVKLNRYENDPTYSAQLSATTVGELSLNGTNSSYINVEAT